MISLETVQIINFISCINEALEYHGSMVLNELIETDKHNLDVLRYVKQV